MTGEFYKEFVSRNKVYIQNEVQKKISNQKILIAGCGLGSVIAESLVRIGFQNFVLVDGDQVETSNLNRQFFLRRNIGDNKAVALAALLRDINPEIEVESHDVFITEENIEDVAYGTDVVINTIDFDKTSFKLSDFICQRGGISLIPLNIGFVGFLIVFSGNSISMSEFIGGETSGDVEFYKRLAKLVPLEKVPAHLLLKVPGIFKEIKNTGNVPQNKIGANLVASLCASVIIKKMKGRQIRTAPDFIILDSFK